MADAEMIEMARNDHVAEIGGLKWSHSNSNILKRARLLVKMSILTVAFSDATFGHSWEKP